MPSSIARLSRLDHERLLRLLRRMCLHGPNRDRWRREFVALLQAHRTAERVELLEHLIDQDGALGVAARKQNDSDLALDRIGSEIAELDIAAADLTDVCDRAAELVSVHAEQMTTVVIGPLEGMSDRKEMRRLGGAYEERRDSELRAAGVAEPTPRRLDLSRAELYELARRAGIQGRSSMSRGQLIDELQRRERG